MALLRDQTSQSARALELTILCATRTIETIGARGAEFDFETKTWCIPAHRMKKRREHRVPLASSASLCFCDWSVAHLLTMFFLLKIARST